VSFVRAEISAPGVELTEPADLARRWLGQGAGQGLNPSTHDFRVILTGLAPQTAEQALGLGV
jgi:hypothetical protein